MFAVNGEVPSLGVCGDSRSIAAQVPFLEGAGPELLENGHLVDLFV